MLWFTHAEAVSNLHQIGAYTDPSAVEADRAGKRAAVIKTACGDDPGDAAQVRDVVEWVAIDEDEIGALAGFDGAGVGFPAHGAGGDDGGRANGFERCHPSLNIKLELAVEAVA